jgi:hypothetical protein
MLTRKPSEIATIVHPDSRKWPAIKMLHYRNIHDITTDKKKHVGAKIKLHPIS